MQTVLVLKIIVFLFKYLFIPYARDQTQGLTHVKGNPFVLSYGAGEVRVSKRNFPRWTKTAFGTPGYRGQTEPSPKIEDLRSNKTTGKLL